MNLADVPIQRKLTIIIMLTTTLVLGLTAIIILSYELSAYRKALQREMHILADVISANLSAPLSFEDPGAATEVLNTLQADENIVRAAVYSSAGQLFATYPMSARDADFPAGPATEGDRFGWSRYVLVQPIQAEKLLGHVYLEVELGGLYRRFILYSAIVVCVVICSLFLAFTLSKLLQRLISAPIMKLNDAAREVSLQKDYSVRVVKTGNDEIGDLTDAFNEMLKQIEERDAVLEQRVRDRTADLTATNAELEAFTYSVSHDLRAPLRHIHAFTNILKEDFADAMQPEGQRYLDRIGHGARQMGQLVDDLLNLSRIGRQELALRTADMNTLVAEVIQGLKSDIGDRQIAWHLETLPPAVCDEGLIKQVWVNLFNNAIKYTRNRPVAEITVGHTMNQDEVIYFVRDNGVGFDMRYVAKLFGVFQRLHRAEDFEGTGVGLALVHRIIAKHHGRIWAEGALDKGATFHFSLSSRSAGPSV